jgi:hypothetical protein
MLAQFRPDAMANYRKLKEACMSIRTVVLFCRSIALALAVPLSASAAGDALNVKVFPDRYVAAGRSFTDVAALEAWAKPTRIRTLSLKTCGAASTRQLLAAVERFQSVSVEGIQIRALRLGEPACASGDAEYFATDESGRSVLP